MLKLSVNASKNYDITITNGIKGFERVVANNTVGNKIALIIDSTVYEKYGNELDNCFNGFNVYKCVILSGEQNKNFENYYKLINYLADNNFNRRDAVITFGGGVVGDLGAFVASTYMRGINLIAVPTTLLSMVDSSVGGKTAIDLPAGKNLCGTFYQPDAVFINLDFLNSLPNREVLSGMGEVIKYAFIDKIITPSLLQNGVTEELIYNCLKIKAGVVERDEKELNYRMVLNLGHTVGHAIETLSNYTLSHGECVAKGINYAIKVSQKLYGFSEEKKQELLNLLNLSGVDLTCNYLPSELIKQIKMDKKATDNYINFVTIKDIGEVEIQRISYSDLESYL